MERGMKKNVRRESKIYIVRRRCTMKSYPFYWCGYTTEVEDLIYTAQQFSEAALAFCFSGFLFSI